MTESTTDDGRQTTTTPADAFDQAVDKWVDQQQTPWMRIKHVTMRSNLIKHLPQLSASDQPLRILDAGGGTGIESIPFAQAGHHVDLVDYREAIFEDDLDKAYNAIDQRIEMTKQR